MAIAQETINSIVLQIRRYGSDGVAFDEWMSTVAPYVRLHGHVGAFRSEAQGLWLSNNKPAVEDLVRKLLEGPSREEQEFQRTGELAGSVSDDTYYRFLAKMGLCRGDTLSVHSVTGELVGLKFDDARLPERVPGEKTAPKSEKKK